MHYYEAIYIVHPNIEDDNLTKVVETTKKALSKCGGELVYEENMGKKRLAYAVEKQKFGTYILLQFQGDGIDISRFGQDLELNDDVLAQMIVSIDPDEIRSSSAEPEESERAAAAADEKAPEPEAVATEDEVSEEPAGEVEEETPAEEEGESDKEDEAEDAGLDEVAAVDAEADNPA